MDDPTRDSVVVVRLWTEAHDERVRARILSDREEDGVVVIGTEAILAAVEQAVRAFADPDATAPRRDR